MQGGEIVAPVIPGRFQRGYDPRRELAWKSKTIGRPPSLVRAAARLAFDQRIKTLCEIADGVPLPHRRRFKAVEGRILPDGTFCTREMEEAGAIIEVEWQESADIRERLDAIEKLGKFGGMNSATVNTEEGVTGVAPVYAVTFD